MRVKVRINQSLQCEWQDALGFLRKAGRNRMHRETYDRADDRSTRNREADAKWLRACTNDPARMTRSSRISRAPHHRVPFFGQRTD